MSQDPYLPPGCTDRDIDNAAPAYEYCPHGAREGEACPECDEPAPPTQQERAFAALDAMSGAKWLPLEALKNRLRKFGHSERWANDTAQEWMRLHSKVKP
jgi:hypothetical protein